MKEENQDALRAFNEDWDKQHTTATPAHPQDPQGGNIVQQGNNNNELGLADQVAAAKASLNPTGVYSPPSIPTTGDSCYQCGTMHPPLRPGEVCKVAVGLGKVDKEGHPITPEQSDIPAVPPVEAEVLETPEVIEKPVAQPLSEDNRPDKIPPQHPEPKTAPPPQQIIGKAEPEPAPLAENNIPTEVHVNKYLNHWGTIIEAHCKTHGITNVKRLMRHLTVEVTDFLEHNKGR